MVAVVYYIQNIFEQKLHISLGHTEFQDNTVWDSMSFAPLNVI
jgi:hypothetical protein